MTAALLSMTLLLGASLSQVPPGASPSDEFARVDRWIQEWQPTAADRRFEEIGWAKDIPEALKLARQHGRPVFVFTHKGRINLGRQ